MIDYIKMPPHSVEAEQAVLGGLMLDKSKAGEVFAILAYSDFYKPEHALIFKACQGLYEQENPFDAVTLSEYLESASQLEYAGGLPYMIELANNTPSAANILAYAGIVKEKATLRSVIAASTSIADMAYHTDGMNADSIIERAYDSLRLIDTKTESDVPTIEDSLMSAFKQLEWRHENQGKMTGIETGFSKLDECTMGLQKGELYVIGARPAMGKTTFVLNVGINAAIHGKHTLFFSLEMPKERLIDKCVSSLGSVNYANIKTGQMADDEWPRVTNAMALIRDCSLRIDDRGGQTLNSIILKCKKLHSKRKLDLIIVDYMQLITIPGSKRFDEVSEVSRQLKALAKNLDCPVIALSQLNRELEKRPDKRPRMSDLRESGQIEQDADLIAFMYRDEVYYPDSVENKGVAELNIVKNRFGELEKILLASELHMSRFKDLGTHNYQAHENKNQGGGFNG